MSSSEAATLEPSTEAALLARHGALLLALARKSLAWRVGTGTMLATNPNLYPPELRANAASFVTLIEDGQLRGCVGTPVAWRPLYEDVIRNAAAAGFEDNRFPTLEAQELARTSLSVSLLSPPIPLGAESEAALIARLRPGRDGLILRAGNHQALFLPEVWRQLPEPREFLAQLKLKAGLKREFWAPPLGFWRFTSAAVAEPGAATH